MKKLGEEDFKILIEYKDYMNVDQILSILDSIDSLYRILYRYKFKLAYNYPLKEDKKLRLTKLSSEKSFEFLFQSVFYQKLDIFFILYALFNIIKQIPIIRKNWHEGSVAKWKSKNQKLLFKEKVKNVAKEDSNFANYPDKLLERLINILMKIYYTLESNNITTFKVNDEEIYKQEKSSEVENDEEDDEE